MYIILYGSVYYSIIAVMTGGHCHQSLHGVALSD